MYNPKQTKLIQERQHNAIVALLQAKKMERETLKNKQLNKAVHSYANLSNDVAIEVEQKKTEKMVEEMQNEEKELQVHLTSCHTSFEFSRICSW